MTYHPADPNDASLDTLGWERLARIFAGVASDADQAVLQDWLQADGGRARLLESARRLWDASTQASIVAEPPDADSSWAVLSARIALAHQRGSAAAPSRRRSTPNGWRTRASRPWLIAAAVLFAATIGIAAVASFPRPPRASSRMTEVVTKRGQRAQVQLTDGSVVLLNSESRLRYLEPFVGGARQVFLDGEAFFTVVHDSLHPFHVRTTHALITDLGTRFDVAAYPEERETLVVVSDGSVSIRATPDAGVARDSIVVNRGYGAAVTENRTLRAASPTDASRVASWTEGRLILEDVPLTEAAVRLSRWYDANITIADATSRAKRVTASFQDEPLSDVVELIAASLQLAVERRGRTIVFRTRSHRPSGD